MKAIYQNQLYVVIETYGDVVELEPVDEVLRSVVVPYSDPTLIIDPTDGDIDNLRYPD